MKELIEKILAYLPKYLTDFGSLISGPKRFMAQKNTKAEETFVQALVFLGISLVLVVIMTAPLLPPGKDIWTYLGTIAVGLLLGVSLYAVALRVAWRLVGGNAPIRSYFVTYAHFSGVIVIVSTVFLLLGEGVFKVLEPDLYRQVIEANLNNQPMPNVEDSYVPLISLLINAAGLFLASIWGLVAWGAYRQLNGLSKWRSFIALMISGLIAMLIAVAVFFIESAMIAK
jgi:hypothetical protein